LEEFLRKSDQLSTSTPSPHGSGESFETTLMVAIPDNIHTCTPHLSHLFEDELQKYLTT